MTSRRNFIKASILMPAIAQGKISAAARAPFGPFERVRPDDAGWPSATQWSALSKQVGGRLHKVVPPLEACKPGGDPVACAKLFEELKNPYYIGDSPALTQTSGWLDAWASKPSAYVVAATETADVVAAVNFARKHRLRIVVKGGGHSYQGTSNAADSLLVWTRAMHQIQLHEAFTPQGADARHEPAQAVTVGAGTIWREAYDAVATKGGRYVQGGGCLTVGVAGLVQSGGFGSFSKYYGTAAAGLLEAELVVADGAVKIVNAYQHPDLFWALKGGGGGSFGIITKLTLRTRELPEQFGAVFGHIKASSDDAFRVLIDKIIQHYADNLFNPQWGEQIRFRPDNTINVSMLFHGLSKEEAQKSWESFLAWIAANPNDYTIDQPLNFFIIPAREMWSTEMLQKHAPALIAHDDRPGASPDNIFWASNKGEAGQFIHSYHSLWLPKTLLANDQRKHLADALFAASRPWSATLHFNKGIAGASQETIAAVRDTATNPHVADAFALAIIAGEGEPAFTGVSGHEPDMKEARSSASRIDASMKALQSIAPDGGSYVSESYFFEKQWQRSFWGSNYARLAQIKKRYDPEELFFVHHGVGTEHWTDDGFTRLSPARS